MNSRLFDQHELEKQYGADIEITDAVFEKLFNFFDKYNWYLDDRPIASGKDINPDVIGYIFEKYIDERAEMGAYYTQEDITGYIARNTILPYLLQQAKKQCAEAFDKENGTIWKLLKTYPEKYIYDDVQFGCDIEDSKLPPNIVLGVDATSDLSTKRKDWNTDASEEFALPTETWRETIARRQRFFLLKNKLKKGKITDIADLITHNLNIEKLILDTLQYHEGSDFISAFYSAITGRQQQKGKNVESQRGISILDPACGSGTFLLAAIGVLEPLYTVCINRMREFVEEDDIVSKKKKRKPVKYKFFCNVLDEMAIHNNEQYWIYRNIILSNLFGVDFMPEAVEVAKLRLFLKLAAAAEMDEDKPNMGLELLPDIDFNIRAGNSLIGFINMEDFTQQNAKVSQNLNMIKKEAASVGGSYSHFVNAQSGGVISDIGSKKFKESKTELQDKLKKLNELLDQYLGNFYDCSQEIGEQSNKKFISWKKSHKPFHWATEFYEIMEGDGFDVVIGNPPYLAIRKKDPYKILGYKTRKSNALHAAFMERSHALLNQSSTMGLIVPMSLTSTKRMEIVQEILESDHQVYYSNYSWRPGKLFEKVNLALSIFLCLPKQTDKRSVYSTRYIKWTSKSRDQIFTTLYYLFLNPKRIDYWIPKINDKIELSILSKWLKVDSNIGRFVGVSSDKIYYRGAGGLYWKVFTNFPPKFYKIGDPTALNSAEQHFLVADKNIVSSLIATLSSNIFWWYYTIVSDVYNLSRDNIYQFRIPEEALNDNDLLDLGVQYLKDIKKNSTMLTRKQTETQQFNIIKSKKIIDEIDKVLAKHYNFSEEELDYIINYDIKYRMNKRK